MLWLDDNRLILDSLGRAVLCDDCPCGSPTSVLSSDSGSESGVDVFNSCEECRTAGLPDCYQFTISGITGSDCANVNGTHTLTRESTSCLFRSADFGLTCFGSFGGNFQLNRIGIDFPSGVWRLSLVGLTTEAYYELAEGEPCLGETLVFNFVSTSACCGNWPATLTLTPC